MHVNDSLGVSAVSLPVGDEQRSSGIDDTQRDRLSIYLQDLGKRPRLAKDAVVDVSRRIYQKRYGMLTELSQIPRVIQHVVRTYQNAQRAKSKVTRTALSVGDQSPGMKDRILDGTAEMPEASEDSIRAALEQLCDEFDSYSLIGQTDTARLRALGRCSEIMISLEFKWPLYQELLEVYRRATSSLIDAALSVATQSSCSPVSRKELLSAVESGKRTLLELIAVFNPTIVFQRSDPVELLRQQELAEGMTVAFALESSARFEVHDRARAAGVARLAECNLRLVAGYACSFDFKDPDRTLDAIQDGNEGLLVGVERFQYWRRNSLSTVVVPWIKKYVLEARRHQDHVFEVPAAVEMLKGKIRKARRQFLQEGTADPTSVQIANRIDVPVDRVEKAESTALRACGDEVLHELPAGPSLSPDAIVALESTRAAMSEALKCLNPQQHRVCVLRFGLGDLEPHTLEEVAAEMGISEQRVWSIEQAMLASLRGSCEGFGTEKHVEH